MTDCRGGQWVCQNSAASIGACGRLQAHAVRLPDWMVRLQARYLPKSESTAVIASSRIALMRFLRSEGSSAMRRNRQSGQAAGKVLARCTAQV